MKSYKNKEGGQQNLKSLSNKTLKQIEQKTGILKVIAVKKERKCLLLWDI